MAVQLIISIDDNQQFGVSGPIENKMLAYGMLELAKEAICEHHRKNASLIQPATMVPPKFPGLQ